MKSYNNTQWCESHSHDKNALVIIPVSVIFKV